MEIPDSVEASRADTIFALSSGPPPSGIAVIRMSGPRAVEIAEDICQKKIRPEIVQHVSIWHPLARTPIDRGILLFFRAPKSFTGEDVVELQMHGSRAVVAAIYEALSSFDGCRVAHAGEFTRRAINNGKLDILGAEALGDLLRSETELQRQQAEAIFRGNLRTRYEEWRRILIAIIGRIEAILDFADEGDIPAEFDADLFNGIVELSAQFGRILGGYERSVQIRDGIAIVILGPPNAGKSSLLNLIAGRDAAIVSPDPGTTRDLLEVHMNLGGLPVTFIDTAGIRETDSGVEAEGIKRAIAKSASSQLIVHMADANGNFYGIENPGQVPVLKVCSRADLKDRPAVSDDQVLHISTITSEGINSLLEAIRTALDATEIYVEPALIANARQASQIGEARHHLINITNGTHAPELAIIELQSAVRALDGLVYPIDNEAILDEIFANFCIGK